MTAIKAKVDSAKAKRVSATQELAALYAAAAKNPAASRVLADIAGNLADPDFACDGLTDRGEGFLARYRAAQRIDILIRSGKAGTRTK